MSDIRVPDHGTFRDTVAAVRESTEEQIRIERALGRALIECVAGKP